MELYSVSSCAHRLLVEPMSRPWWGVNDWGSEGVGDSDVSRSEVGKEMMMVADNKYLRRARRYHIHEADVISRVVHDRDTPDILVYSGGVFAVDHRANMR